MSNSARRAQGFDFGTSPHGLSADLPVQHQETPSPENLLSLADAFKGSSNGGQVEQDSAALAAKLGNDGGRASGQPESASEAALLKRIPFHYLELTDEQCSYVAFALICHIEELEESKEAAHPEVLEALCGLNDALHKLERRPL